MLRNIGRIVARASAVQVEAERVQVILLYFSFE